MKQFVFGLALVLMSMTRMGAAPITTQLQTGDLGEALTEFTSVAYNATARWQSNGTGNFKMRISDGTSGSPNHLVSGGSGITWGSDSPQAFTLNFDGAVVTFTIVDGANTHTIRAETASTQVNALMIALRSQAGNGISSEIAVSNLALNGVALSIASASLGLVNARTFLLVEGLTGGFTLTGNLRIAKTGGAGEIPSMILFAGKTSYQPPTPGADAPGAETPEPGTLLLLAAGLLLLAAGKAQGWMVAAKVTPAAAQSR